jgi:two-component system, OmpR family, heavy metal sensor histidine kinase CusS
MKSIRISLLVYFLALVALTLGVASVLAYRTAQQTLRDKEVATGKLIDSNYEQACAEERRRFDETLRTHAQNLARQVQIEVDSANIGQFDIAHRVTDHVAKRALPLGPYAILASHVASAPRDVGAPRDRWPMGGWLHSRRYLTSLALPVPTVDEDMDGSLDNLKGPAGACYQIESDCSAHVLFSPSLDRAPFPSDDEFASPLNRYCEWDDVTAPNGAVFRRVRLKVSRARKIVTHRAWPRQRPRQAGGPELPGHPNDPTRGPGARRDESRPPATTVRSEDPAVSMVVHFAADPTARDEKLAEILRQHDAERTDQHEKTVEGLAQLRSRLVIISAATFGATIVGVFGLVWLGLLPLHRLGDAVSRVSAKDFRLPIDAQRLPVELQPIAVKLAGTLDLLKRTFAREKQATADISHELRTPLSTLITTIDLALRRERSAAQLREMLADCRLSAEQMHQIVDRMLTLARLDAGTDVLKSQPVDVGELAEQCVAVVRPLAEANGLSLGVNNGCPPPADGTAGPARLQADPDKLREVFNNLLHNAIQYNRPSGRIDLTVGRMNGCVCVEVSDTGVGINAEAREHVFERFYRADPSRNSDGLHTGLGLAIAKEYVELMGGTIAVESVEGQGSTFRVQLPVRGVGTP